MFLGIPVVVSSGMFPPTWHRIIRHHIVGISEVHIDVVLETQHETVMVEL